MSQIGKDKRAFINYARIDENHASRVGDAVRCLGWALFIDNQAIPPGSRWRQRILEALKWSDLLIIVLTPAWARSDWAKQELGLYCSEVMDKRSNSLRTVIPLEFEVVSAAEHMVPLITELAIVQGASQLSEDELCWMLLCGVEDRVPGPRHQWESNGRQARKRSKAATIHDSHGNRLTTQECIRLEHDLYSQNKSILRIREIACETFKTQTINLSTDPRSAWYQLVRQANEKDLVARLCEFSKKRD